MESCLRRASNSLAAFLFACAVFGGPAAPARGAPGRAAVAALFDICDCGCGALPGGRGAPAGWRRLVPAGGCRWVPLADDPAEAGDIATRVDGVCFESSPSLARVEAMTPIAWIQERGVGKPPKK